MTSMAQLRTIESNVNDRPGLVEIYIRDSENHKEIPGALITVTDGKDTLRMVGSNVGYLRFQNHFSSDTLTVNTSLIGYKPRTDIAVTSRKLQYFWDIFLEQDALQLTEIIVQGDAIAMVAHGDTTIFNVAAFKTMEGDGLRNVLLQMPGVKIDDNTISYNGRNIDRILVNGSNFFGKDVNNAMDLILAKEVKNIKFYEKQSYEDLDENSIQAKEHVMDVSTWRIFQNIGELRVGAGGGIYTSLNNEGKIDYSAGGLAMLSEYSSDDKPRITISVFGDKNGETKAEGLCPSYSPMTQFGAKINIGKDKAGVGGWNQGLSINHDNSSINSGSYKSFSPSQEWLFRNDTSIISKKSLSGHLQYIGDGYYKKNKSILRISGNASANLGHDAGSDYYSSLTDGFSSYYMMNTHDTLKSVSYALNTSLDQSFNKKRRKLSISFNLSGQFSGGSGERSDTLSGSMNPILQSKSSTMSFVTPKLSIVWLEPIKRKSFLKFSAISSFTHSNQRLEYLSPLTGDVFNNISKDFYSDNFVNTISLGYRYGRMNDGVFAEVILGVKDIYDGRTERLGNIPDWSKNYLRPVADATISYSKGVSTFSLKYGESERIPYARELRPAIDDTNPLLLISGNPKLKLQVNRTASIMYGISLIERNINITVEANGTLHSNPIVTKTTYLDSDTHLLKYDYHAAGGASLISHENAKIGYKADLALKASKFVSKTHISLNGLLGYSISSIPFFWNETLQFNHTHNLTLESSISYNETKCRFLVDPHISLGRLSRNNSQEYGFIDLGARFLWVQRIWKCFEIATEGSANILFSTQKKLNLSNYSVDSRFSYLFGKEKRSRLTIFASDLFNDRFATANETSTNYLEQSYTRYLGRSVGISFIYTFTKR